MGETEEFLRGGRSRGGGVGVVKEKFVGKTVFEEDFEELVEVENWFGVACCTWKEEEKKIKRGCNGLVFVVREKKNTRG